MSVGFFKWLLEQPCCSHHTDLWLSVQVALKQYGVLDLVFIFMFQVTERTNVINGTYTVITYYTIFLRMQMYIRLSSHYLFINCA